MGCRELELDDIAEVARHDVAGGFLDEARREVERAADDGTRLRWQPLDVLVVGDGELVQHRPRPAIGLGGEIEIDPGPADGVDRSAVVDDDVVPRRETRRRVGVAGSSDKGAGAVTQLVRELAVADGFAARRLRPCTGDGGGCKTQCQHPEYLVSAHSQFLLPVYERLRPEDSNEYPGRALAHRARECLD